MKTFKQYLKEAPIPPGWDNSIYTSKTPFSKRIQYAVERAKRLGTGSSRVAFEIEYEGRPTVLKIAKNKKGLAQNRKEGDWGLYNMYPDVTVPLIDKDEIHDEPLWLHCEKAEKMTKSKFYKLTGFDFDDFTFEVSMDERRRKGSVLYNKNVEVPIEQQKIQNSELFYMVCGLLGDFDLLASDLTRVQNWGIYNNNPVIIDLGFDTETFKLYYK